MYEWDGKYFPTLEKALSAEREEDVFQFFYQMDRYEMIEKMANMNEQDWMNFFLTLWPECDIVIEKSDKTQLEESILDPRD